MILLALSLIGAMLGVFLIGLLSAGVLALDKARLMGTEWGHDYGPRSCGRDQGEATRAIEVSGANQGGLR